MFINWLREVLLLNDGHIHSKRTIFVKVKRICWLDNSILLVKIFTINFGDAYNGNREVFVTKSNDLR